MHLKITLATALSVLFHLAFSQSGNYFLTHYAPSDERIDYVTYGMAQDQKGIIYFANKSGVLEFDGRNWSLITTPGPVYTISTQGDHVFVAGFNGFGKLNWSKDNVWSYESLSDNLKEARHFFASQISGNCVYFLNREAVFIHSILSGKSEIVKGAESHGSLKSIHEIAGTIYVYTELQGLCKIDQGKLIKADLALPDNEAVLFTSLLYGKDRVLIGSESGRLFIYDNQGLHELNVRDRFFLETNVMVNGTWVSETLVAVATLRGGVIFINTDTGETEEITNFYKGLPDNEVYSLFCDRNQGVWVTTDYGFTRIAPYLPFRSYNHYKGLEGNLLCVATYRDRIYVGTTLGLFSLEQQRLYENPIVVDSENQINRQIQVQSDQRHSKKDLFAFLRKQQRKSMDAQIIHDVASNIKPKGIDSQPAKSVLKPNQSFEYSFKKVDGIDGKVTQLIEAGGELLAAGDMGVVEVDELQSKSITFERARSVLLSLSLRQLIVSTFNQQVKTFEKKENEWKETHLLDTLQDYVSYIFEDKIQNIWLCSRTTVYKVETIDHKITNIESIIFSNPSIDEATGVAFGSDVYVAASGTFNRFDVAKNKFEKYDSMPGPRKYFGSAGYFWFFDGHRWRTVDPRMQSALKVEWLSLFQNIRFISPADNGEGLWVITANNELYKFSSTKVATEQISYPLFLREVRSQQNKMAPAHTVRISQLESTVTFEFIQPDFLGMRAVEYRYTIKGLSKGWSAWSADNNIVNFSYLPVGNYQVEVQTRDLMGKISNVETIELEVEPPYWKRSWFYAVEFFFFTMLVFVSLRMGRSNSRYRLVSRLLSLLTVIMLIQFIQTVVTSQISLKSTPVMEFFVQVCIALLIFPLEELLRRLMLRSEEGTGVINENIES